MTFEQLLRYSKAVRAAGAHSIRHTRMLIESSEMSRISLQVACQQLRLAIDAFRGESLKSSEFQNGRWTEVAD